MDHYPLSHSEFHILRRCVLNLAKTNVTEVKQTNKQKTNKQKRVNSQP